jgi:hypothetical protein
MIKYVDSSRYGEKAKETLLFFAKDSNCNEFLWRELFYEKLVDLKKDAIFIKELLSSGIGKYIFSNFIEYLEKGDCELRLYSDILLYAGKQIITNNASEINYIWGLAGAISKMILELYDQTSDICSDDNAIAMKCLELWDTMYEKNIGLARNLTKEMVEM